MQITSNLSALEQTRGPVVASPVASAAAVESAPSDQDVKAQGGYVDGAQGDVEGLKGIRPFPIDSKEVKVAFQVSVGGRNVRVQATAHEEGENLPGGFPFPRPGYNSRLFSFRLESDQLKDLAPQALGQTFALDCPRGIDARLALIEAGRSVVEDVSRNGKNLGYEAPTGVRVSEDEEGDLQSKLEGGRRGFDITKPIHPIRPTDPIGPIQPCHQK
jgi:hypothetical protein